MNPLAFKNQKRHPIDTFRVRYWYQGIAKALDCQESSYQVEKRLERERFTRKNGRTSYPGKWSRYAQGMHTPQVRYVRSFESQVPGSARELNHPLWAILKRADSKSINATDWMTRLDPSVQMCVFRSQHDCFGAPRALEPFGDRQGQKLLRRGDLDALAALVLYWHEAARKGEADAQETVAALIYQMLLIIGLEFHKRKLNTELLQLFTATIFNTTPWLNGRFAVDSFTFEISILILHRWAHSSDDPAKTPRWRKLAGEMVHLLKGKKGWGVMFAMKPFFIPCWDCGPPRYCDWAEWEGYRRRWAWGWACLQNDRLGKFPPKEVFYIRPEPVRIQAVIEGLCALPVPILFPAETVVSIYGDLGHISLRS